MKNWHEDYSDHQYTFKHQIFFLKSGNDVRSKIQDPRSCPVLIRQYETLKTIEILVLVGDN